MDTSKLPFSLTAIFSVVYTAIVISMLYLGFTAFHAIMTSIRNRWVKLFILIIAIPVSVGFVFGAIAGLDFLTHLLFLGPR